MLKILLPVDGSEACGRATDYVIGLARAGADVHADVLNVQAPV